MEQHSNRHHRPQSAARGDSSGHRCLVETDAFRRLPDQTSYPVAGSFVSYLLQARAMTSMQAFFQTSARGDSLGVIEGRFTSAFGWSIAEAESNWRAFLAVD